MTTDTDLIRENNQEGLQVGDFKVGDRVWVIRREDANFGKEGVIVGFDESWVMPILVAFGAEDVRYSAEELEHVATQDFKVGDRVEIELPADSMFNGRAGTVVGNKAGRNVSVLIDGQYQSVDFAADELEHALTPAPDVVAHPPHYVNHPSGVECIQITEHMGFNLGNAVKYIWRCDLKQDAIEDLRKSIWYIEREIARREAA